ncbi:MAG: hypothetical protein C0404_00425 [Verrucomicrobia bacterium]|nr:hypothetical protein [Verrucomicrobiota bacterium]
MATYTLNCQHNRGAQALEGSFFQRNGYTRSPVVVQCYVTLRCGLSCAHCLAPPGEKTALDMPLNLFDRLCGESATLGVGEMLLTGGEPLQRQDLEELIGSLRKYDLAWTLNTAACPDPEQQQAIRQYPPTYVAVSIDGPASVHDEFRGHTGAFEQALSAIRFFSGLPGVTVCAGTTVTTKNQRHLNETLSLVKNSGAHKWGIHLLIPEGRAALRKDLFLSDRQMRQLLRAIVLHRKSFPVTLCDEMGYAGEWESLVRDETFFCAAGRAMCAVLPDGSIMPCSTTNPRYCEGNLTVSRLDDIWTNGFIGLRNQNRTDKCARCADWAVCGGACWLQRIHGTQCFKHLWKLSTAVKSAAGLAVYMGSVTYAAADPGLSDSRSDVSSTPMITAQAGQRSDIRTASLR